MAQSDACPESSECARNHVPVSEESFGFVCSIISTSGELQLNKAVIHSAALQLARHLSGVQDATPLAVQARRVLWILRVGCIYEAAATAPTAAAIAVRAPGTAPCNPNGRHPCPHRSEQTGQELKVAGQAEQ